MTGLSRRGFLGVGAGALAFSAVPLASTARAEAAEPNGTLVVVHLVGGVDGLAVLVPEDDELVSVRPGITISPAGEDGGALPFVAGWGLHPALAPLVNEAGPHVAFVGGVGFEERWPVVSHIRGLRLLWQGRGGSDRTGWGTRALRAHGLSDAHAGWWGDTPAGVLRGLTGERPPRGRDPLRGYADPPAARRALETAYAGTSLAGAARTVLAGDRRASTGQDAMERGYPDTPVGRRLAAAADWVRADPPPRLVTVHADGFDTHRAQGDGRGGVLANRLDEVSRSLAGFWRDVESVRAGVTLVAVSEFGRAIGENRLGGTNHGAGGVAVVMDQGVRPGLHGDPAAPGAGGRFEAWPITVDTRQLFVDVLRRRGFAVDGELFSGVDGDGTEIGLF